MKKGYLVLSNGMVFEGIRFGAEGDALGELVFTTGMTGYIETLTDPSYYGQIILFTFPLVGNYGIMEADFEGAGTAARGCVLREWCDTPSNFRCEYDLDTFLKKKGIPGLYGIDTRRITRIIREYGVMNAVICDQVPADLGFVRDYTITEAVRNVSTSDRFEAPAAGEARHKVTLIDYGTKYNIVRELQARGCDVTVVPCGTTAEEILAGNPDGIMLSNGPGDPAENVFAIAQLQKLVGKVPLFGICLGHQLLALANGGKTVKLKYGHRGANQPVEDLKTKKVYITSQNHGYAVTVDSLEGVGELRFINTNDQTCEGVDYPDKNAFSVQFHPEAHAGPQDTAFLFDRFIAMMKK